MVFLMYYTIMIMGTARMQLVNGSIPCPSIKAFTRLLQESLSTAVSIKRNFCLRYILLIFNFIFFRFGSDRRQRKEINLSIVLLCIVLVFFCSHAARILLDVYEFSNMDLFMNCKPHWRPAIFWVSLQYISHFTMILNSSLNFFVYCLVGHTFRRELCRTLGFKVRENFLKYMYLV